jgi:hypothetical protein
MGRDWSRAAELVLGIAWEPSVCKGTLVQGEGPPSLKEKAMIGCLMGGVGAKGTLIGP